MCHTLEGAGLGSGVFEDLESGAVWGHMPGTQGAEARKKERGVKYLCFFPLSGNFYLYTGACCS